MLFSAKVQNFIALSLSNHSSTVILQFYLPVKIYSLSFRRRRRRKFFCNSSKNKKFSFLGNGFLTGRGVKKFENFFWVGGAWTRK